MVPPGFANIAPLPLTLSAVLGRILAVLSLIGLNAFFVAAEFSIVSVRRSRIDQLVSTGDVQAKTVQSLQHSLERLLSTTQLGITLSSLALGWIGESTVATLLAQWLGRLPLSGPAVQFLAHSAALPLAFFLIAYLQIVLGELWPKSVALMYPERIARVLGPPSLTIARVFTPLIWVLNQSTRFWLRLAGVDYSRQDYYGRLTPEELQLIISTSTEVPDLEKEERQILNNVFEFRDITVEEVMVPRTQITAIEESATFQDLLDEMATTGYSRYPVTGDSLDDIRGIIYFKDLAQPLYQNQLQPHTGIQPWIQPARVVPDSLPLPDLLAQMQQSGLAMVIVVDDFGGTAGLLTLRDLTAEIMGEVREPDPAFQSPIVRVNSHTLIVPAQTVLEEVNNQLQLSLPLREDYQSLGGFVIFELQKIPQVGESLRYDNLEFTVTAADGPRLHKIQVRCLDHAIHVKGAAIATARPQPDGHARLLGDDTARSRRLEN
ncbi:HlyC/CorC family transporter [Romeria aff. gracilis LEGE 07310]|uniref:HlyC/CorC family transporter n=1 Tax=Vasconcelosia minhoensis LEGE 07310 TaxID=915328 RepID=A0A8J7AXS3_9CYAN|nr:hemolysin family protein [Romeria gracilis]MBE9079503.1 HlyC/CorC family transporter [Romeria aff. gracilis LEGE 07310]